MPGTHKPGWDILTRSEVKVALLITEGLTNPQIAERLSVSRKTVATHVSHILNKLGVNSRVSIAREVSIPLLAIKGYREVPISLLAIRGYHEVSRVTLVYEVDNPTAVVELLNNSESKGLISITVKNNIENGDDTPTLSPDSLPPDTRKWTE